MLEVAVPFGELTLLCHSVFRGRPKAEIEWKQKADRCEVESEGEEQVKQAVVVLKGMTCAISLLPINLLGVYVCVLESDKHTQAALEK